MKPLIAIVAMALAILLTPLPLTATITSTTVTPTSFMDKYYPEGHKDDSSAVFGYAAAETLTQVLRQCGDDLSRTNIMRQAASLVNFHSSVLLPGIAINTSAMDFRPIEQMRLVQFDGRTWMPLGWVLDTAFVGGPNP